MSRPFFAKDRETSKALFWKLVGYEIAVDARSPKSADTVLAFHKSEAREVVASAPARTSKSYSAAVEIAHDFFPDMEDGPNLVAATNETICWIVAIAYDNAKEWDYARRYLIDLGLVTQLGGIVETDTNSPNQGNMTIKVRWPFTDRFGVPARSILQVKSSVNEKTLQGEQVKTAIVSEAAEHDRRIYEKYLRTRCGRILFPTTPKRKALWLYEHFQRGIEDPSLSIAHFQFDRFCNPKYDHEGYERAREIARLTYGRAEDDPEFMEQYEGQWTFEGGKVLPFRWLPDPRGIPNNIADRLPDWIGGATYWVSFDYGWDQPAVALFWAVSPTGELCIVNEIVERHLTDDDLVDRVLRRCKDLAIVPYLWVPDPQRPVLTEQIRKRGLPLFNRAPPAVVRDRPAGYQALRNALSVDPAIGRPRLTVYRTCEQTISEWKNIRFKDKLRNEYVEGAISGRDDCTDSARYFLMSYPHAKREERSFSDYWTERQRVHARIRADRAREARIHPLLGA